MVFLPNPPVEDAAGSEADKSLRLPCEMFIPLNAKPIQQGRSLFLWGYAEGYARQVIFNKNPQLRMDTWQVLRVHHRLKHAKSFSARLT